MKREKKTETEREKNTETESGGEILSKTNKNGGNLLLVELPWKTFYKEILYKDGKW